MIDPLPDLRPLAIVLAVPPIEVSTALAFAEAGRRLTSRGPDATVEAFVAGHREGRAGEPPWSALLNDFEEVVTERWPEIGRVARAVRGTGPLYAAVTGSGAAVFGVYADLSAAHRAATEIGNEWQVSVHSTIGRQEAGDGHRIGYRGEERMEVTEVRISPAKGGKVRAFASVVFDDSFIVNDLRVIEGREGQVFVTMPARKTRNGQMRDIAHPLDAKTREMIEAKVLEEFAAAVDNRAVPDRASKGGGRRTNCRSSIVCRSSCSTTNSGFQMLRPRMTTTRNDIRPRIPIIDRAQPATSSPEVDPKSGILCGAWGVGKR